MKTEWSIRDRFYSAGLVAASNDSRVCWESARTSQEFDCPSGSHAAISRRDPKSRVFLMGLPLDARGCACPVRWLYMVGTLECRLGGAVFRPDVIVRANDRPDVRLAVEVKAGAIDLDEAARQ